MLETWRMHLELQIYTTLDVTLVTIVYGMRLRLSTTEHEFQIAKLNVRIQNDGHKRMKWLHVVRNRPGWAHNAVRQSTDAR